MTSSNLTFAETKQKFSEGPSDTDATVCENGQALFEAERINRHQGSSNIQVV